MPKNKADQCITVRLPKGLSDELRAATGQPTSTLLRYMAVELMSKKRAERDGKQHRSVVEEIQADIASLDVEKQA